MKPIILRAPEIRAALDTGEVEIVRACKTPVRCPYGQPGERRWVRETWQSLRFSYDYEYGMCDDYEVCAPERVGKENFSLRPLRGFVYMADGGWSQNTEDRGFPWRPSIHMPRHASRLVLEITDVRLQRVQDLTNEDALRAGVKIPDCGNSEFDGLGDWEPRDGFADMLDSRAKAGEGWEDNPPVWVVTARRVEE